MNTHTPISVQAIRIARARLISTILLYELSYNSMFLLRQMAQTSLVHIVNKRNLDPAPYKVALEMPE